MMFNFLLTSFIGDKQFKDVVPNWVYCNIKCILEKNPENACIK